MSLHVQTARHLGLIYNFTLKKQNANVKRSSSYTPRKKKKSNKIMQFLLEQIMLGFLENVLKYMWLHVQTLTNPNDRNLIDITGLVRVLSALQVKYYPFYRSISQIIEHLYVLWKLKRDEGLCHTSGCRLGTTAGSCMLMNALLNSYSSLQNACCSIETHWWVWIKDWNEDD